MCPAALRRLEASGLRVLRFEDEAQFLDDYQVHCNVQLPVRCVRWCHSVVFQQVLVFAASLALSALTSTCIVLTTVDIITEHHGGL